MPTQIEARYLSGNDINKTISGTDKDGYNFKGKMINLECTEEEIMLFIVDDKGQFLSTVNPHDTVTLDGNMRRPGTQP